MIGQIMQQQQFLLRSSLASVNLCCAFNEPQQTVENCWAQNPFCRDKPAYFHFFSSNFHLQGQILSTDGVALS
jgi:hypothetical protein